MADYIRDLRLAKWGSGASLHGGNPGPLMYALGQKQTSRLEAAMSALPPKADIAQRRPDVRFVPKADSCTAAKTRAGGRRRRGQGDRRIPQSPSRCPLCQKKK
jgi:hypothetical protein